MGSQDMPGSRQEQTAQPETAEGQGHVNRCYPLDSEPPACYQGWEFVPSIVIFMSHSHSLLSRHIVEVMV